MEVRFETRRFLARKAGAMVSAPSTASASPGTAHEVLPDLKFALVRPRSWQRC